MVLAAPSSAQLGVAATTPANDALAVPTATTIAVTFTAAVNRSTVDAASFHVFGRWSGVVPGALSFSNGDRTATFRPARPLFPGETVFVNLARTISGAAGGSLTNGHGFSFWTRSAPGSRSFTRTATLHVRRPGENPIRTYGAYAGDLDGDGAPDLSLPNEDAHDVRVMMNDGCGEFSPPAVHALPNGSFPSPSEGQDLNGDGLIDLAVANIGGDSISILIGDGTGGYLPAVTYPSGRGPRGLTLIDVEGDGDADVVTANRVTSNLALHRNNGDGTFMPATFFQGGGNSETAVAAADANDDGIGDLFVGNYASNTVTLLLGDGTGGFSVSATRSVQSAPWMITSGDVDGDGHADCVVCNSRSASASIVRGDGNGGLMPAVHYPTGNFPLAVDLGDLDGDGSLDLAVSNFSSASYTIYFNDGTGRYGSPQTFRTSGAGSCMLVVDHDRDGDMDLLAIDEIDDLVHIHTQSGPSPPNVQPPHCAATLRLDNFANRNGYGGAGAHAADLGSTLFLGVTGGASLPYVVLFGAPLEPGTLTAFGLLNLSGEAFLPPVFTTDADGEDTLPIPIPTTVPIGLSLAFQAAVADPGHPQRLRLSNPEVVVTR